MLASNVSDDFIDVPARLATLHIVDGSLNGRDVLFKLFWAKVCKSPFVVQFVDRLLCLAILNLLSGELTKAIDLFLDCHDD